MDTIWYVVVTVMLSNGNVAENGQRDYTFHTRQRIEVEAATLGECEQFSKELHSLARMEVDAHYSLGTKCEAVSVDRKPAPQEFAA